MNIFSFGNSTNDIPGAVVSPMYDVEKSFIKEYNEKNYKIGESLINTYSSAIHTNAYYLCTILYPTIVETTSYISSTSKVSLRRYDVFVNNPTIKGEQVEPTSKLDLNYNLKRFLNNNYTTKTPDSIDVKNLSSKSKDIVNIINSYMNTIDLKSTRGGENIVYTAEDLNKIVRLIVNKKILLKNPDIITNVVYAEPMENNVIANAVNNDVNNEVYEYGNVVDTAIMVDDMDVTVVEIKNIYMEPIKKEEPEKKGGKRTSRRASRRTSRRTSRRARKSKKSIRKSKLGRRHRK